MNQEKYDQLILQARACIQELGVEQFRMEDLCAQVSVSRRTLYNYLKSKEDVLLAVVELESKELLDNLQQSIDPALPFCDFVLASMVYMIQHQNQQPCFYALSGSKAPLIGRLYRTSSKIHKAWKELLQPSYERALANHEIDSDLNLNSLLSWYGRLALSYAQFPAEQAEADLADELRQFVIRGIRAR